SKNGAWPLYVALYSGQGLIFSWINFTSTDSSDFGGDVSWIRPNLPKSKLYPAGFAAETTVMGSIYIPPPRGQNILPLTDANLVLDGGNLSQTISDQIIIGPNNRVTSFGGDKLSL